MITANIVTYLEMIPDPRIVRCIHWITDNLLSMGGVFSDINRLRYLIYQASGRLA